MFETIHGEIKYTVYAVRENEFGTVQFLVCELGKWKWLNDWDCAPVDQDDDCYICKDLKEKERFVQEGSWTNLEISRIDRETLRGDNLPNYALYAYGEGVAKIACNFCPNCGRRLHS